MSTLFAMSQVALFGRDMGSAQEDTDVPTSSSNLSTADTAAVGWPLSEMASSTSSQPSRWRINSGDLEEMMRRAAAGLGLDKAKTSCSTAFLENGSSPFSGDDHVEERDSVVGFPASNSRGSSPLYHKHDTASDFQLEHTLDTTAPSSPCTPSLHVRSLSAVSPTSTRSDEAAFQHQLSPDGDSQVSGVGGGSGSARLTSAQQGNAGNTSGRFGLKLLVSNSMAGTLIGKGGTRICEIKDECLADIKVTPNGRFYPGTHERVVLVVGEPSSVQMACDRIVTTIYTAADTSLDITQRVLIPDAASGLIIGHDAVRLGDLRHEAGVASIQVSPRDMCTVAGERVITLQGAMSSVIHGLTIIVERMMEDPSASRYQNMSTIYRAVHLHLPPYTLPVSGMHDGSSPRHPRLSPSYAGPSPHGQHDFHSPGAVAARGRDYGSLNGATHWDFGYGGNAQRDLTPHGTSGGGNTPVEYGHRSVSMSIIHAQEMGSPTHQRCHTAPNMAHFGGRHFRQGGGGGVGPRDFDIGDAEVRVHDFDDCRRDYDAPASVDMSRQVSRKGYLHHSPRLAGPASRDFDHMRQSQQQPAVDGFAARGAYPNGVSQQPEFMHMQQQRLRQQHLSRQTADFSQEAGVLLHESRTSQHRGMREGCPSTLHLSSASVHGCGGGIGSPVHGGELRRCHSNGGLSGDASGLAGMFDGMTLNSPNAISASSSVSAASANGLAHGQGQVASGAAGCVVQGELPVPDADVGIILGKGGATVRELQQLSGAKIMIARRNEFMPGTKHRLVTLAGAPLAVQMARFLIMRKIQTEKEKL